MMNLKCTKDLGEVTVQGPIKAYPLFIHSLMNLNVLNEGINIDDNHTEPHGHGCYVETGPSAFQATALDVGEHSFSQFGCSRCLHINIRYPVTSRSWDSSVSIATAYWLDGQDLIPGRGKRFFSAPQHPDHLWGPLSLLYWGLFLWG
jgi:hypothetical protein